MFVMVPRAVVSSERIGEVLETDTSVVPSANPVEPAGHAFRAARAARRRVPLPGRRALGAARRRPGRRAGPDHGDHRLHRLRQDDAGQPHPAAVRRHRRLGAARRRRRARPRPGPAVDADRARPAEAVPVRRHRAVQPRVRQAGRVRRGAVARARGRAGPAVRRGAARGARRADLAGRHQRVGRPETTARDSPGAGQEAVGVPVRRLVLRARLRHGRGAARGARARDPGRDRAGRRAARGHHPARRLDRRAWRTAWWSAWARTPSCWSRRRPTGRSCTRRSAWRRRHEHRRASGTRPADARRSAAAPAAAVP